MLVAVLDVVQRISPVVHKMLCFHLHHTIIYFSRIHHFLAFTPSSF